MGAVTEMALSLAREIAADGCDGLDINMRTWRRGQIVGILRMALQLDFDAAWKARPQFDTFIDQLKYREQAP